MAQETTSNAFGMPWYYYVGVLVLSGAGWAIASQVKMFELPWKETAVVSSLAALVLVFLPAIVMFARKWFSGWGNNNNNFDFSFEKSVDNDVSNRAAIAAYTTPNLGRGVIGNDMAPPDSENNKIKRKNDNDEDDIVSNISRRDDDDDIVSNISRRDDDDDIVINTSRRDDDDDDVDTSLLFNGDANRSSSRNSIKQ